MLFSFITLFSQSVFAQHAKEQPAPESRTQNIQTIKLKVAGITCAGDCKDIQKEVSKLSGVISCKLIGKPAANSFFEVAFDPNVVTKKEINKKIEETPGCDNPAEKPYKVKAS